MKKIFKNWKWYELVFLAVSVVALTVSFVVGADKNWLSYITSIFGILGALLLAKGFFIAPFIIVIQGVLYSIVSYIQAYYGEMIIYVGIMIPISILSIIFWLRNRKKENNMLVEVNKVKGKEFLCLFIVAIGMTFGFYFLLRALNTSELIISTLSLTTSAVAAYLSLRRCSYYALWYVANDIVLIILWSTSVAKHGISYLPMAICFAFFLMNDIYGFVRWKIDEKKQKIADGELVFNIKKTKAEDGEDFVKLKNKVWRSAYSNILPTEVFDKQDENFSKSVENFKKRKFNKDGHIGFVVRNGKDLIAFIDANENSFDEHYKELGYAQIGALYIDEDFQHKGIGKVLFEKVKKIFAQKGKKKFIMGVFKDNQQARNAYEKWGGVLDDYSVKIEKLGKEYDEVFYVFDSEEDKRKNMKILLFSDLHGSLNALNKLAKTNDWKDADKRIFLGDVVVGFSRPDECIDVLKKTDCICLLGNNDDYIANKIPQADLKEFHEGKLEQIEWMNKNVSDKNKEWLRGLEKEYELELGGKKLYFTHYPWEEIDGEYSVIDSPKEKTLKTRQKMFKDIDADYIFFGHEHGTNIFEDEKKKYICVTTSGLENPATYFMIYFENNNIKIEEKSLEFNIEEEIELMGKAGYPYNKKKFSNERKNK